ncbi:type II toxin-antitoxin system HicB family antitoxin [Paenibacillus sanguinis]|uniref:type II toxin-antitoxin system HicB family antitoxin n=1 Tax=Paenibacillus sanguinis TaxID=225906 RepID=UPI00037168FB|nr:type II toxin-antitoxin system HicB family antitoxin [Paenibacillus sanguinis]
MKKVYPVVLSPTDNGYVVYVPDLDINTEGTDLADAIYMARDAIGIWGISEQDMGRSIPEPSSLTPTASKDEIVTLVDIDFEEYRRKHDNRTVRKNLTIPSWLNVEAEHAGINFSSVLQNALKNELGITEKRP